MKSDDGIDMVVLFSGTWVWAAHLVAAVRDYVASGKPALLWTHPGIPRLATGGRTGDARWPARNRRASQIRLRRIG
jgi:hypothetical protein